MLATKSCDLVLLDINLPDMDGVEIARRLRNEYPSVKILTISCLNTEEIVQQLVDIGIEGFISKQEGGVEDIIHAVSAIMDGYEYYGSDISKILFQIYVSKKNTADVTQEFSSREKEIIELCRKGLLAKEIAEKLNISVSTVNNHKSHIFSKLNINSTVEMVQYALDKKIIRI